MSINKPSNSLRQPLVVAHEIDIVDTRFHSSRLFEAIVPHLTIQNYQASKIFESKKAVFLKVALGIGGIIGRIPLIPLSTRLFPHVRSLGYFFASTNFLSYSAYLIWATSRMTNEIISSFHLSENTRTCSREFIKKISWLTFNILNGCVAQSPYFILSWDYNKSAPYMVALNAMDVSLPIYSLQIMTSHWHSCQQRQISTKINNLKRELLFCIKNHIQNLIEGNFSEIRSFFLECDNTFINHPKGELLLDFLLAPRSTDPQTTKQSKWIPALSHLLGTTLLVIQMAWFALLCTQGIKVLTTNNAVISLSCIYVIICNIALTRLVLVGSCFQALFSVSNCFRKKPKTYLSETLYPKIATITKILSTFVCLTALIPAAQMSKDYLPDELFWPSTLGYGLGFALMDYLPLRDLSESFIHFIIHHLGPDNHQLILRQYQQLTNIYCLLEQSSEASFFQFLKQFQSLPSIDNLLKKHQLEIRELESF